MQEGHVPPSGHMLLSPLPQTKIIIQDKKTYLCLSLQSIFSWTVNPSTTFIELPFLDTPTTNSVSLPNLHYEVDRINRELWHLDAFHWHKIGIVGLFITEQNLGVRTKIA